MADRNASDSRHLHSPAAFTPPIYMDNQGSDSSIPLSPQWLLPKMGESKHESGNEDERSGSVLKNDKHLDILNSSKSGEVVNPPKKKDVFRPSLLDQETVRHDRWRDEERDTNPAVRRDRWREGDREPADNRKIDRWSDKLASKHYGENQRASSDRWGDSGNKDAGHERRESKWTNRWGPTDKDKEVLHEKPRESGRVGDITHDKGVPTQSTLRKDDKEGDVYRPWKLNSSSQSRGRGDTPHSQTLTPSKNFAFSYGRGRSENQPQPPGHTLGRPSMSISQSEFVSDKEEIVHSEFSFSRYSRAKLLDVYRTMDKQSSWKLLDGFVEVPSLTQNELCDPLGLSAPSPEETDILMGIDKGEVLSSGVPVNSKEKPAERHPNDFSQSRRPIFGSREDLPHIIDGNRDDNADEGDLRGKHPRHYSENSTLHKSGDLSGSRDVGAKRDTYVPPGSSLRSPSVPEHAHLSHWERNVSDNIHSSGHEYVRSPHMKNLSDDRDNGSTHKLYPKNETKWQVGGHRVTDSQFFGSVHQGNESRKLPPPSPEDLILFYKDPQGNIQGPFSGSDIIGWYDAGYFGIDLQVRLASASEDHPFSVLGDVMPHLRSKAQPPPGFNAPKQSDPLDVNSKLSHSNSGKLLGNFSEMDSLKNDLRPMHGFSTDADNKFLESLMAGPQGFFGSNSSSVSPIGVDNANLYLLAQKMALEHQQRSWPGRDPSQVISKPEIGPEGMAVHPKLHTPLVDNTRLTPPSQNSELLNILQGVSERSTSGLHSAPNSWSNFPVPGGPIRDNMDLYRGQNMHQSSLVGIQHQILQAQNSPLLVNLLSQSSQSAAMKPETIPSFPQDPQTLSMLQQQYLINLHSQTPTLQQLSVLDKLLLLQQQQKKLSEQQQLLRQQNMHSQAFSEILPQHPGGLPYGQMQVNASQGGSADQLQHHMDMAQLQFNASMHGPPTVHDDNISELHKVHPQDVSVLKSQTPEVISKLGTQIPQEVIQSGSNVSQDALKFDPSSPVEVSDSFTAQFANQPSKNTTSPEINFSQHLTETHKRIAHIDEEVGDGYKSLGNSDSLTLKPSNVSADATLTLQSVSRNQFSAPPKSVELHESSKVSSFSTENDTDKSKERVIESHQLIVEPALEKDTKITETYEGKKGSEKKSRKQKASKAFEQARGVSKTAVTLNKLGETDGTNVDISKGEASVDNQSEDRVQQTLSGYENILKDDDGSVGVNSEPKLDDGFPSQNSQLPLAWKPAPGFKPKSLLEIQQEELRRSQAEVQNTPAASSANSSSLSTPWAGVVANADTKTSKGSYMNMGSIESVSNRALKPQSSKSELQDLLADKVNTKLNDVEVELLRDNQMFMSPGPLERTNSEPTDDLDFIQAKDTKKSRKKSGKTKSGSSKMISVAPDASLGSSPIEKIKNSRQVHQETEVLPPVPSGPSFGDFVVWKGDGSTSSSVSSSYAPAWSTDSGKVQPVLLRDILKEQEKKTQSLSSHQKPQSTQPAPGSIPSRAPVASSLSKAQVSTQVNSISTQSKHSGDDDLFWGPIDSSKKDAKQSDFPQLSSHSVSVSKSSTPLKGNIGGSTKQKSVSSKTADYSQSYSPQTTFKGRKDSKSKQSEAMDFRDWCQAESVRLIGTKDTSFLEFCLKQTRSEAEILLVENIGSYDPKHEFIDKFLNYKELLPADVLEIAFQSQNDQKSISRQASLNTAVVIESTTQEPPSTVTSGSKKKSKKGKKVSPSVLGFNVVSNRIMMGEIQTVED